MFIILEKNIHTSNPLITNEPCKKIKKPVNQAFDIFFLKGQKKKINTEKYIYCEFAICFSCFFFYIYFMTGLSENHRFFWWLLVQGITRLEEDLFYLKIFNLMFQVQHKEHLKITQHMGSEATKC